MFFSFHIIFPLCVVMGDRPEVKQDGGEVITAPKADMQSFLNFTSSRFGGGANIGQITTCSRGFVENSMLLYKPEILATKSEKKKNGDLTWHMFSDLDGDLASMIPYNTHCHSQLLKILDETPALVEGHPALNLTEKEQAIAHNEEAKKRLTLAAADETLKTYHYKYMLIDGTQRAKFEGAASDLIKKKGTHYDEQGLKFMFGYVMSNDKVYYHIFQVFEKGEPGVNREPSNFVDPSGGTMTLSTRVDHKSPSLPIETSSTLEEDVAGKLAVWATCPDKGVLAGDLTAELHLVAILDKEYHVFDIYPSAPAHDYASLGCRMQEVHVISSHTSTSTLTDERTFMIHQEYEIPAFQKLVFEAVTNELLRESTEGKALGWGFLLSNHKEWNGFLYYHLVLVFENTDKQDLHKRFFDTWTKSRVNAADSGSAWMKLTDAANEAGDLLSVVIKRPTK